MEASTCSSSEQKGDDGQQTTPPVPKFKHDWYQTDMFVVLFVLARGLKDKEIKVTIKEKEVTVTVPLSDVSEHILTFHLSHTVIPEQSSYKIFSTKVEIKLKKRDSLRWTALEGDPKDLPRPAIVDKPSETQSGSCQSKNWDKLASELTKEDKPEGEDALNALFQQIYDQGSDEVKKAMNKSFVESGGTVLSTNWKDVAKDKVDVKAPDGMEWREWEQ